LFISSDIKKLQKQTLIQIIFSTDVILGPKVVHMKFFLKISILFDFMTKSQRNLPENTNKEAI